MINKKTKFAKNWNNKLGCSYFSTIRVDRGDNLQVGELHDIILDGKQIKRAEIMDRKVMRMEDLTNADCWLDSGYNYRDFRRMMMRMYSRKVKDWSVVMLVFVVFKSVK